MAVKKFVQIVTPKGEAFFPNLKTTEKYEGVDTGKYTCQIKLSDKDTSALIARLEEEWDKAKESPELAGKNFKRGTEPVLGYRETKNGEILFKAKTNAEGKSKAGERFVKTVPVLDTRGHQIKADVGQGSIIKLSMTVAPYYMTSTNYGLSLYLNGVMVYDLKEKSFGQDAASLGFSTDEEGYVEGEDDDLDDIPFVEAGVEF